MAMRHDGSDFKIISREGGGWGGWWEGGWRLQGGPEA